MKKIFLTVILCFFNSLIFSQSKEITLEDIWENYSFYYKSYRGINSMNDGEFYTQIKNTDNGQEIIKYSFKNGERIVRLFKSSDFKIKRINSYSLSSDDKLMLLATEEPGVINQIFRDAVEEKGLFYPPDPASKGSSFLGGNLAENSGGPKALKYGVTKDYVLNLEVVLPTGEIIWTGANVLKNSTGYDLTSLMVGSEGTLGIITKIVFKLIPLPTKDITLLVPFTSAEKACEAVSAIFISGITPSALEFIERDAIDWTIKYTDINMHIDSDVQAHLLIEVDGNNMDQLFLECEKITEVLDKFNCSEILIADSKEQKDRLWKMRRQVGEAVKSNSIYKEEDTVVPRAELPKLLLGVKDIGKKYGFKSVCYGHAGDGNLHVNIIKSDMYDEQWNNELYKGIREIFTLTKNSVEQ